MSERLAGLCRLWGAVKFFHPYMSCKDIDWDRALVEAIPLVREASSAVEYREALEHLLSFLGDPMTAVASADESPIQDPCPEAGEPVEPRLRWADDGVGIFVARDFASMVVGAELTQSVAACFTELERAGAIVLDLRGAGYHLWWALDDRFGALTHDDVRLPARRSRVYSGYPSEAGGYTGYTCGFHVADAEVLEGRGGPLADKPLTFVLDHASCTGPALGMAAAGRARLVFTGDPRRADGTCDTVELTDGLRAFVRTSELVMADGSVGLVPDAVVAEDGDAAAAALDVLAGRLAAPAREGAVLLPVPRRRDAYEDAPFPPLEQRLLALFKYWTVIDLFFPYIQHLDRPWDEVLLETIPRMEAATDETAYVLALAACNAQIRDTHGFLDAPAFQRFVGTHTPSVLVRLVEDRSVIVHVTEPVEGLDVGDVLLSVDGEQAAAKRARLAPYLAASTPQALEWRLHQLLLGGPEGSEAELEILDAAGDQRHVRVTRDRQGVRWPDRPQPVFGVLPEGFGYMDLARLTPAQVDEAFEAVRDTPALVIDDRCYPHGTAWAIAPRLSRHEGRFVVARFRRREPHGPDPHERRELVFDQVLPPPGTWRYTKPVVVLIYEESISQAEHTCLLVEAACDPTFVGTATNGANGDVTAIQLPGGVRTMFSGHDVRHADGRQLQRVGIQPHVEARPTIAGIRAGRDEVLEAAVRFLDQRLG
ncbi:MAG: S41 family peptidase [Egibacteraceae bacterium]